MTSYASGYPRVYGFFSSLYGQACGRDRLRIRRAVRNAQEKSRGELARRARELFAQRVRHAAEAFPAYRDWLNECGVGRGFDTAPLRPEDVPAWTRDAQRSLFDRLRHPPVSGSFVHATGGSTGAPVRFYVTRASYEWRTAVADRGYAWAGAEEGQRSFYVWGTPVYAPSRLHRLKQRLHHCLQRRTYFDSFAFGHEDKAHCCAAIDRARPRSLVGYAGNLVELAQFALEHPSALHWRAKTVITAAEGLQPGQRELLQEVLADRVFVSYGSREFMLIGMECSEQNGLHVAGDNLYVEVADDDGRPLPPGKLGRILVTDLHNDATPFIRYEIGDLGVLADPDESCPCGLPFPRLHCVAGRLQEAIALPNGDRMTALFLPHLMKEFDWVLGYQVVQQDRQALTLHIVSRAELTGAQRRQIELPLRERVGY
mgnify:CR=1 FL=1